MLAGTDEPPAWEREGTRVLTAEPTPEVLERYRQAAAVVVQELTG